MATLTGNTIKDTYKSLLKVNDNGELAATLQELTDGLGNGSGISINTTGDLKATGILEFGSLKDTGEDITISKFVDAADGIAANDNDTTIPTTAAIIDYVAAQITLEDLDFSGDTGTGSVDLDSQVFSIQGTANEIETLGSGQTLTIGLVDSPTVSGTITAGTITDGTAILTSGTLTGNLTGTVTGTSVLADGVTATTQITSDNSTKVATTAFVKSVLTLEDLDFQGDTGTGSVDLDSQSLDIAGGTGINTAASGQTLTVNIDSTVATLTGTQILTNKTIDLTDNTLSGTTAEFNAALSDNDFATLAGTETLTNKTVDADNNTISNLEVDNLKAGVLDTDLATVSTLDDTLASAKAIKTYVDAQVTAQDLDFTGDTGTGAVDLDSQSLSVTGGTGIDTTASGQDVSIAIDSTVATLTDTQILTNKTIDADSNTVSNLEVDNLKAGVLDTDLTTVSATDDTLASAKAIKTYVDAQTTAQDLDITDGTVTSAVDLDSQTMTIQGTTNEIEVGLVDQTFTVGLPDDVVIAGDLTVNGTTTTVNTETLSVEDPLIEMANQNAANTVDTGFYANYSLDAGVTTKYAGLFKDASDSDTFKLFKGLEVEPTTTVDTAGTGYALADLDVAGLSASSGVISGDLTVDTNTLYVDSTNNRVGVGTSSPNQELHISSTNPALRLEDTNGTSTHNITDLLDESDKIQLQVRNSIGSFVDTVYEIEKSSQGASKHKFSINGSETLVLDSIGLGIGTTSPSVKLDVNGSSIFRDQLNVDPTGDPNNVLSLNARNSNDYANLIFRNSGGTANWAELVATPNTLAIETNSVERLRIDSSGNVGIGTTSPATKLQINTSSAGQDPLFTYNSSGINTFQLGHLGGDDPYFAMKDNSNVQQVMFRLDGGSSYINTGNVGIGTTSPATTLEVSTVGTGSNNGQILAETQGANGNAGYGFRTNGTTRWNISTIGTDGSNSLRFYDVNNSAERMRIDSSGNVGIGTSSPSNDVSGLHIAVASSTDQLYLERTGGGTGKWWLGTASNSLYFHDDVANSTRMIIDSSGVVQVRNQTPTIQLYNTDDGLALNQTLGDIDWYQIDPSDQGVGTVAKIRAVNNSTFAGYGELAFHTGNATTLTERMRITSGGNVLVGKTADDDNTNGIRLAEFGVLSASRPSNVALILNRTGTDGSIAYFRNDNTQCGDISVSGTTTSYNTSSDYRLKEDTKNFDGLAMLNDINVYDFKWKESDKRSYGVFAHELQEVLPQAVNGEKDAEEMQSVDYSKIVPILVKAIQQQQAEIETLKSQINP